ncbi:hypothetical protein IWQ62_001155 [Dispira parvispora]|uniref:Uncharacterized protein n=1 Tax=Dispira parvispora TaxID=1520584 RepID=A0A9W8E5A1_9FUNG|nr:hypothetical protein IWQ62_001155 [Dispira parvispora]
MWHTLRLATHSTLHRAVPHRAVTLVNRTAVPVLSHVRRYTDATDTPVNTSTAAPTNRATDAYPTSKPEGVQSDKSVLDKFRLAVSSNRPGMAWGSFKILLDRLDENMVFQDEDFRRFHRLLMKLAQKDNAGSSNAREEMDSTKESTTSLFPQRPERLPNFLRNQMLTVLSAWEQAGKHPSKLVTINHMDAKQIVYGYIFANSVYRAESAAEWFLREGIALDSSVFHAIMRNISGLQESSLLLRTLNVMHKYKVPQDHNTYRVGLKVLSRSDSSVASRTAFRFVKRMAEPETPALKGMLLRVHCQLGEKKEAMALLHTLQEDPNPASMSALPYAAFAVSRLEDTKVAQQVYDTLNEKGFAWDVRSLLYMMGTVRHEKNSELMNTLDEHLTKLGTPLTVGQYGSVLLAHATVGHGDKVKEVLGKVVQLPASELNWKEMQTVFRACHILKDLPLALEVFEQLKARNVITDSFWVAPLVHHALDNQELKTAEYLIEEVDRNKWTPRHDFQMASLRYYVTRGDEDKAEAMVKALSSLRTAGAQGLCCSLIHHYMDKSNWDKVLHWFNYLMTNGGRPTSIVFTRLLNGLVADNQLDTVWDVFEKVFANETFHNRSTVHAVIATAIKHNNKDLLVRSREYMDTLPTYYQHSGLYKRLVHGFLRLDDPVTALAVVLKDMPKHKVELTHEMVNMLSNAKDRFPQEDQTAVQEMIERQGKWVEEWNRPTPSLETKFIEE